MDRFKQLANLTTPRARVNARALSFFMLLLAASWSGGCTAITNPIASGVPVRLLPPEILGPCKANYETIPLNVLEQQEPEVYKLDAGDVLGVYIEGLLGDKSVPLPVYMAPLVNTPGQSRLNPGAGYPVRVESDGTIALPRLPKLPVKGLSVGETNEAIQNAYVNQLIITRENLRVLVTLLHKRQHQVLVFRQEATSFLAGQDGPIPISKRNVAQLVDLPGYQNDVLHALAQSGGLPELDAYNEIIIHRSGGRVNRDDLQRQLDKARPGGDQFRPADVGFGETIRLPLRLPAGATLPFGKDDVILHTGDVVFLEARDEQVFFTAGLLPPGKHMLPRDHDLDVLDAITMVRGPLYNGAFGGSNLAGNLVAPGLGSPTPSLVVVLRRIPGRGQIPIVVDLREALLHPQERLVIRPGDMLLLQEKPEEAFARYMTQTFFNFNILYNVFNTKNGVGVIDVATPDRLSTTTGQFQIPP